jgi:hypothetical protein
MPCDRTTPRCRTAKSYHHDLQPCCRGLIVEVVDHFSAICSELDVRWWADYGTLLGAVRNKGIIPHDKDADVSMLGDDWEKLLNYRPEIPWVKGKTSFRATLEREIDGFVWVLKKPRDSQVTARYEFSSGHFIKVRSSSVNHTNLDVFPWYLEPDGKYHRRRYISIDRYKGRQFRPEKLHPIGEIEWEGRMIPAPADPAWFCQHRYGHGWGVPIKRNNDGIQR